MNDMILDEIEKPYGDVNEHNLAYKIFLKPKQTIQYVLDYCPEKHVNLFLVVAGIVNTTNRMITNGSGADSILGTVVFGIILGAIFGKVGFYIYSLLLHLAGNWLKGNTDADKFIIIIAWSCVPTLLSIPVLLFKIVYFGNNLLSENIAHTLTDNIIIIVAAVIKIILSVWSIVILIAGVAQVQKFSNIKATANVVLASCIIIIPILIIIGLVYVAK